MNRQTPVDQIGDMFAPGGIQFDLREGRRVAVISRGGSG